VQSESLIFLSGASGYVGGRLLRRLEQSGRRLRCMARKPEFLRPHVNPRTEVFAGDVFRPDSLRAALAGADTAYYLIHSMSAAGTFEERDRDAARNFGDAAREAGVRRIIYLGGLGAGAGQLSPHLRSRHEVGELLRASGVRVIEFRASIVIGSGSLSFEIVRALVERLPIMIAPRWVRTPAQPIGIEDVVAYLAGALDLPQGQSRVYEIGGADQASYGELMLEYARQRGLRRVILPVPVLTPHLSSLWLTLVSPAHAQVGRLLIEGLRNPTLVRDTAALRDFPVRPMSLREAIERALRNEDREFAETRWSDALSSGAGIRTWGGIRFGSRIVDSRSAAVPAPAPAAFRPIRRIGGRTGWYYGNWLWRVRGLVDSFFGGVGLRRGRRDPEQLSPGDTLDFWRVEACEPDRKLRLLAEMKLPGRAWLEFEVTADGAGSVIRQTAIFDPVGLPGLVYWYALYPLHTLIFRGMLRRIAAEASRAAPRAAAAPSSAPAPR
jgi:uncharacterized protein YbjT (DUF2867 family)